MSDYNSFQILHNSNTGKFHLINPDNKLNIDKTYLDSEITKIKKDSEHTIKMITPYKKFKKNGKNIELIVYNNKNKDTTKKEYTDKLTKYLKETAQNSCKELSALKQEYNKSIYKQNLMKGILLITKWTGGLTGACMAIDNTLNGHELLGGILGFTTIIFFDGVDRLQQKYQTEPENNNINKVKSKKYITNSIKEQIKTGKIGLNIEYLKLTKQPINIHS